jgi:secreted pullulanase
MVHLKNIKSILLVLLIGIFSISLFASEIPENVLRIHYQRTDENYDNIVLWIWNDTTWTSPSGWPDGLIQSGKDDFGVYWDVPLKESANNLGFLMVNKETQEKDGGDKGFTMLNDYNEVYTFMGEDKVYVNKDKSVPHAILKGEILSDEKILLNFTKIIGVRKSQIKLEDKDGNEIPIKTTKPLSKTSLELNADLDLEKAPFKITFNNKTIQAKAGWRLIDSLYSYDGNDLGVTYKDGAATFKIWSPKASKVSIYIYDKNNQSVEIAKKNLNLNEENGVWTIHINPEEINVKDLKGYYYQYEIINDGVSKRVLDPYAKSMAAFKVKTGGSGGDKYTVNSEETEDKVGKGAILNPSEIGPNLDYAKIDNFEKREDAIIWEIHIRDFTSDPSIEKDLNSRWGTYKAFIDKLDYIKSLGVTHVQLLPVMAWYYGDETSMEKRELNYSSQNNSYNWGYDPHNYFSPDGAYSMNAEDPQLRINELKELIKAIHDAGMGVILDVVYTHMAQASLLNDIVPNYYFFMDDNGNFVGGFGNNLATSHKMAEKLMVDSVKYWFDEYKIDGMRWDMMGDATADSVQKAYDEAKKLNPNALFIGEGWRTFSGKVEDPSLVPADQDWMMNTDDVAVFSDEIRNELKSGFGSEGQPRFITGGPRDIKTIFSNIIGKPSNVKSDDPGDIVQYIAAHDNLPLHDVIAQSIKKDPATDEEEIQKRIRLGNTIILTSQGISFLHAGQEYGRTKQWKSDQKPEQKYHYLTDEKGNPFKNPYFIHDSYDSSDAINMFEWNKVMNDGVYKTTVDYTKGLIALRKSTDAFRLGDHQKIEKNVKLLNSKDIKDVDLVIAFTAESTDGEIYYVIINADSKVRKIQLNGDIKNAKILVDAEKAGIDEIKDPIGVQIGENSIILNPLTATVLKLK